MSAPKPAAVEHGPVLTAFDSAPLDKAALTLDEATAIAAQIADAETRLTRGDKVGRTSEDLLADLAKREG